MDDLVRPLASTARVLDLGAGAGSFDYAATAASIVAVDMSFPATPDVRCKRVIALSELLPFQSDSFDVVICNHTLEHFERLQDSVNEIDRVLKPGGRLWVSVPDCRFPDDRIYRLLFKGGGHVNEFTLETLIQFLERKTALRAISFKPLYSGFVYLNRPAQDRLQHFPRRARFLGWVPFRLSQFILRWMTFMTRTCDRILGTHFGQYGWGVVFHSREAVRTQDITSLKEFPADLNVCFSCGCGHCAETVRRKTRRRGLVRIFNCPQCSTINIFCNQKPDAGADRPSL